MADRYATELSAAKAAALAAGKVIRSSREDRQVVVKSGVDLVTEVDHQVEELVRDMIKKQFPDDLIIGEEEYSASPTGKQGQEIPKCRAWCVDPIDGTTNFVHGYPFVAVSIGYCEGGVARVGVVYNPYLDALYEAAEGGGAFLNGRRITVDSSASLADCLLVNNIGHSRDPAFVDESADRVRRWLGAGLRGYRASGSAAQNMAHVASGQVSCYYEHGYGGVWDVCAGSVLVKEAGGVVRDAAGGGDYVLRFGRGSICCGPGAAVEEVMKVAGPPKVRWGA